MSVPVMDVEDVERLARHEGAAKALRYLLERWKMSSGVVPITASVVLKSIREQAEYHEGFLPGAAKPSTRTEEAVALVRRLVRAVDVPGFQEECDALDAAAGLIEQWDKEDGK